MNPTVVNQAELAQRILAQIRADFREAEKSTNNGFLLATIPIDFIVTAPVSTEGPEEPEPCCVCVRVKAGIICSGDCCADVIDAEVIAPQ